MDVNVVCKVGSVWSIPISLERLVLYICVLIHVVGASYVEGQEMASDAYTLATDYSVLTQTRDYNMLDNLGDFECYTCGAYQHSDGDDFERKLKACREHPEKGAISTCPYMVAGESTYKHCRITKQTVFGHVTSFSRGCHFLMPCNKLKDCEDSKRNMTGVCQQCCETSLCNTGTRHTIQGSRMMFVAAIILAGFFFT